MRTTRIYVDLPLAVGAEIELPPAAAEHVVRVLRLPPGATLSVFNGDGCNYLATLQEASRRPRVRLATRAAAGTESALELTLAQALARGDKMDWVVQKATELGVAHITPLVTERSEVRLDAKRAAKRLAHWQAVAISASEQSGRARVPDIAPPVALEDWISHLPSDTGWRLALLPDAELTPRQLPPTAAGGVLVVGPEGGLGDRDCAILRAHAFTGLRLGPRILRTETAGLAALAALQAVHGDS